MIPAGDASKGYVSASFTASGTDFPVMQDIKTKVYGAGKGNLEDPTRLGNVMYTRGVVYGMILVEALRVAQNKFGKGKVMTPEQLRWGFEHLNLTEARIKELGARRPLPADQDELRAITKARAWSSSRSGPATASSRSRRSWPATATWCARWSRKPPAKYAAEKKITPRDCAQGRLARLSVDPSLVRASGRGSGCGPHATTVRHARRIAYLSVNNIEVIYDHVILVLKGVSLEVPEGAHRRAARRQRRGQEHDAEGDLQSARGRARRRHQGHDRVQGQARRQAHHQRPRAHGRVPGDGRPALLRAPDGRGESADRRVHAQGIARRDRGGAREGLPLLPAPEAAPRRASPATRRAASSR